MTSTVQSADAETVLFQGRPAPIPSIGALLITIYPASPTVGAGPLVQSFAVVLLGGLGSVPGAILAGLLIGVLESFISFLTSSGWQNVLLNYLVIAVLLVRPAGLPQYAG